MVFAALAGLVLALELRVAGWLKALLAAPAVLTVIALVRYRGQHVEVSRHTLWVVVVLLWSTTNFGLVHEGAD